MTERYHSSQARSGGARGPERATVTAQREGMAADQRLFNLRRLRRESLIRLLPFVAGPLDLTQGLAPPSRSGLREDDSLWTSLLH